MGQEQKTTIELEDAFQLAFETLPESLQEFMI